MVRVGGVCIDRFEHPGVAGAPPLSQIDWAGAREACAGAGKRVCTEAEWLSACEGAAGRRWPTGDTLPLGACHIGQGPSSGQPGEPRTVDPAGGCATPEGVHDLAGNVWEWVAGPDRAGVLRGGGWDLSAGFAQCRVRATPPEGMATKELGVRCCADPSE
jgi:formylglycine-generating enzyme required for sulfatase activity